MAETLAFFHWVARIDAKRVDFVLGLPRLGDPRLPSFVDEDSPLGDHRLWALDFDQCQRLSMDEGGAEIAAQCLWGNRLFIPRPLSSDEEVEELWQSFQSHYLERSKAFLSEQKEDDAIKDLPELVIDIFTGFFVP